MTAEDRGFKMLKQQCAEPFRLPISLDIWEKRGMFPKINLEENEENIDRTTGFLYGQVLTPNPHPGEAQVVVIPAVKPKPGAYKFPLRSALFGFGSGAAWGIPGIHNYWYGQIPGFYLVQRNGKQGDSALEAINFYNSTFL